MVSEGHPKWSTVSDSSLLRLPITLHLFSLSDRNPMTGITFFYIPVLSSSSTTHRESRATEMFNKGARADMKRVAYVCWGSDIEEQGLDVWYDSMCE